jgi:hypothetical protein
MGKVEMKKQITNKDALRVIAWWAFNLGKNDVPDYKFDEELEVLLK